MKTEILAADALARAVKWVRGQIRQDRANRYSLVRDWKLPAAFCSFWPDNIGTWESSLLRIERNAPGVVTVTVKAYHSDAEHNICDGATLSPDKLPGILPAALFHDPWYCARTAPAFNPAKNYAVGDFVRRDGRTWECVADGVWLPAPEPREYEALAELLGVKPRVTRKFGDALFYSIARAGGSSWLVAHLYHLGIRIGYPVVRPFICAAIVALLAGGCAGCIGQGDDGTFVDPSQFTPPAWEQNQ